MGFEAQTRWIVILATGVVGFLLVAMLGLSVQWGDTPCQVIVLGGVAACVCYFHLRKNRRFVEIAVGLLQFLTFSVPFTAAMYAACAIGRPLWDDRLAACDAALGVHLPAVVQWTQRHPLVGVLFDLAYHTVLPQTIVLLVVAGWAGRYRELHRFLLHFFLGLLLVLGVFAIWPAAGPFAAYGFEPSVAQTRYLEHFHAFRDGASTVVCWRGAQGLVTFPSFHTVWALLLVYAVRWNRWLFVPSLFLNLAVIVSTMTTGWHYFADVLGGIGAAVVTIAAAHVVDVGFARLSAIDWAQGRTPVGDCPCPGLSVVTSTLGPETAGACPRTRGVCQAKNY